ncbi:MAG: hypothetical protein AAGF11_48675 [Myxococcota bacterium]
MSGMWRQFPSHVGAEHRESVTNTVVDHQRDGADWTDAVWLVGGDVYNPHATDVAYLQLFAAASADVTLGTDGALLALAVPPGASVSIAVRQPVLFNPRLSYAATSTRTGSVAPTSALTLSLLFARSVAG